MKMECGNKEFQTLNMLPDTYMRQDHEWSFGLNVFLMIGDSSSKQPRLIFTFALKFCKEASTKS